MQRVEIIRAFVRHESSMYFVCLSKTSPPVAVFDTLLCARAHAGDGARTLGPGRPYILQGSAQFSTAERIPASVILFGDAEADQ